MGSMPCCKGAMVSSGLELEGQTRASLDSLIRAKRAEWARQIAENE
mgnify:CR=1 FL=1